MGQALKHALNQCTRGQHKARKIATPFGRSVKAELADGAGDSSLGVQDVASAELASGSEEIGLAGPASVMPGVPDVASEHASGSTEKTGLAEPASVMPGVQDVALAEHATGSTEGTGLAGAASVMPGVQDVASAEHASCSTEGAGNRVCDLFSDPSFKDGYDGILDEDGSGTDVADLFSDPNFKDGYDGILDEDGSGTVADNQLGANLGDDDNEVLMRSSSAGLVNSTETELDEGTPGATAAESETDAVFSSDIGEIDNSDEDLDDHNIADILFMFETYLTLKRFVSLYDLTQLIRHVCLPLGLVGHLLHLV
jgi:hypothetical protein